MPDMELFPGIATGRHCSGRCVRGMRIWVTGVLDLLATGLAIDEVLTELPDLERDDVIACLEFARRRVDARGIC